MDEEFLLDDDEMMDEDYLQQLYYEHYMRENVGMQLEEPQERIPFWDQCEQCWYQLMEGKDESGMTVLARVTLMYAFCILTLFTSCLGFLPPYMVPMTSLLSGWYFLFISFGKDLHVIYLLCGFSMIGYIFIYFMQSRNMRKSFIGWRVGGTCFTLVIIAQVLFPQQYFLRIRGMLMIMTMKLFSLGSDIETGNVKGLPSVLDFYSYCMGVNSVVFGPWISYRQHSLLMKPKDFMTLRRPLLKGTFTAIFSISCLLHSSCFLEWLIPDDYQFYSVWFIAFRDAMAFRFSHYFICFTGEAAIQFSGYSAQIVDNEEEVEEEEELEKDEIDGRKERMVDGVGNGQKRRIRKGYSARTTNNDISFDFPVTRPFAIELPRSLVDVVVNWNIPMHTWLKKYVFLPSREAGGRFIAIFLTYTISSLLHGFNFQISAVLLSLGVYTYGEHVMREKLARAFNSCIRAKACEKNCGHTCKKWNIFVILFNFGLFLLSIFHLAYLGMVFDSSDTQDQGYNFAHTMDKWSQLNYASHYIALGVLVFGVVI